MLSNRLGILSVVFFTSQVSQSATAQSLWKLEAKDLNVTKVLPDAGLEFEVDFPLFSYDVDGVSYDGAVSSVIDVKYEEVDSKQGIKGIITFSNPNTWSVILYNVIPFGRSFDHVLLSGEGEHPLSRSHLFIPGRQPVNVILPDNAWELGFATVQLSTSLGVYGLVRRDPSSFQKAERKRFETLLLGGGSVKYFLYADLYHGEWQEGLRKAFQERKLHDLETFDDALYQRKDLQWIRQSYVMHLLMAWDKDYYDGATGKFNLPSFISRGKKLYGGDDVICLWPTWPTLGLDQRNQFDLYRDLPGRLPGLRTLADTLRSLGAKFFIAYNPWDESTRLEGHLQGLESLIRASSADGVVLDTKGESSKELQAAADKARLGVVMYSEGMAVPKDMPGIVSGRVHNALYYPPMLNLNKIIKPDFAIFRVTEVFKEPVQREYAVSFFNGYGTEINQFAPGHPEWEYDQYRYLGKTTRILRENHDNFISVKFLPLITTTHDSIWVNEWPGASKTIYTVFSKKAEGFKGLLFKVSPKEGFHFVDLWHHKQLEPVKVNGNFWIEAEADAFPKKYMGTNNEGEVDCIAMLPSILKVKRDGSYLNFNTNRSCVIKVWKGMPAYDKEPMILAGNNGRINLYQNFGTFEGKIVVQAFDQNKLLDEAIIEIIPGTPKLISFSVKTPLSSKPSPEMVRIPSGRLEFKTTHGDEFIRYPQDHEGEVVEVSSIYMDKFPVTNRQFEVFLESSGYWPKDTVNFLRHWKFGEIPKGQEDFPLVYVSYEDALAYAQWAGKRLPTEIEWQYAAQTQKGNEWPWKQVKPVTRKEEYVNETLKVTTLEGVDPKFCNLGDGKLYPVGKYPRGANPLGLHDLVGCVWQLTNDVYESGSYRYIIMKGGSYFKPSSSWWYVQGGPRELHYRQYLLRVSQGFERTATVGFRCVKDY